MDLKELADRHGVKIFEDRAAAEAEGFDTFTETSRTRNVWNRQSAAEANIYRLAGMKRRGEASEVGLVLDPWSVTGCYKKREDEQQEGR